MQDETETTDSLDLTGRLLIAMPGMGDPRFAHSVVFLCAHSKDGAMGLIVNKAIDGMRLSALLDQLSITLARPELDSDLYFGGPVETGRGFVLHTPDYVSDLNTLMVSDDFSMTATQDVLEAISVGAGPTRSFMALGYAGWGAGQLEREIADNGWLTCDAPVDLVFDMPNGDKWAAALKTLGVDPVSLSAAAGRA
ncbi:YqgE/AlgH family protein [Shimia sp. Alg240-R146]|uniref:YqgE/AlgH family protein n=1 Tax=Shimia sp. Alg240-R146 TaxID=2993449 RepID=UPI0022E47190|nr:YqgE/AlgH family protein [Shimia sp. Alg240-R146]